MREEIKADLGEFPFPTFWGPMAGIPCSEWIANSARWVEDRHQPTLSLVYLPHLDYGLQKYGPGAPEMKKELQDIDRVAGELIEYYEQRGIEVILLSEYGISKVSKPIHLNRIFVRRAGSPSRTSWVWSSWTAERARSLRSQITRWRMFT